jgi:hypothetical protein
MATIIKHEERFTDQEMLDMFTWDAKPKTRRKRVWKDTRKRGFKKAVGSEDTLIEGVSVHPPGSKERLTDLAAFYDLAVKFDDPPSPFDC